MLDFKKEPFNYLPLNNGDLFDLTCEYLISLIEKLNLQYSSIVEKAETITQSMPNGNFDLYKDCFNAVDNFIDNYTRLVKSCKLSLGQPVARVQSKHTIFNTFTYSPDVQLQELMVHGLRNTAQHFEERLQDYQTQIDPFLQLTYLGQHITWQITFGNGGYRHSGNGDNVPETFDSEKLHFQSYKQQNGAFTKVTIKLNDVWRDIEKVSKLVEENMQHLIIQNGICCPPPRNVSVFVSPS